MKNINDIKAEKEKKVNQLVTDCLMFFAFSNEQFQENKTPKEEGEKYVHIGGGGYLPKSQLNNWINGIDQINAWFKEQTKNQKLRRAHIAYELANHEAFYTCDISDTLSVLGSEYTEEEVLSVYHAERKKQTRIEAA